MLDAYTYGLLIIYIIVLRSDETKKEEHHNEEARAIITFRYAKQCTHHDLHI